MTAFNSPRRKTYETSPPTDFKVIDLSGGDVTPDDGSFFRGFSFAVDGDIVVDTMEATQKTIPAGSLAATIQHGLVIRKFYQSGTTATGIIGWY